MSKMMSKKRICLLAVGLTLLLAAGFFLALPRTLFDEPFSATVWSRDGRLLSAKVAPDGQWRFFPTDSVPGKFRTAITTYEDKRFDRHFGVDPLALARAVGQNLAAGRIESGASTLTMQTIRLSRGGKPRTFGEKFVEAVLALRLEGANEYDRIKGYHLAFGEFDPTDGLKGQSFVVDWGDGTSTKVEFDLYVVWKKNRKERIYEAEVHSPIRVDGAARGEGYYDAWIIRITR